MYAVCQSPVGKGVSKWSVILWLLLIVTIPSRQRCNAEENTIQPSLLPVLPTAGGAGAWISGPTSVSLDPIADIKVPAGYRLTGARGARALLEQAKNPVSPGLVGILAPDSGTWWIVLEFADIGYVPVNDQNPINAAVALQAVRTRAERQNMGQVRQGLAPIGSVNWQLQPAFDPEEHTLEWAIRVEAQGQAVINHSMRLLGRRGVLEATAVVPSRVDPESVPLKELMKGVSFKQGQRYADYQSGDKVSSLGLAGLIAGDDSVTGIRKLMASINAHKTIWASGFAGLLACAGAGGIFLWRKLGRRKALRALAAMEGPKIIGKGTLASQNGNGAVAIAKPAGVEINHHGSRRKKQFDYQKFYSQMLLQVSPGVYGAERLLVNGRSPEMTGVAGQPALHEALANQAFVSANLELIANQKNLIEEQKRLMQEQTKLIEEKSRLIEEKNRLLERQSEMMESNLL